jgi:CubicO group peptidase (beta-lactamase class C family)
VAGGAEGLRPAAPAVPALSPGSLTSDLDSAALKQAWQIIEGYTRPQANGHPLYPGAVLTYGHAGRVATWATGYSRLYGQVDTAGSSIVLSVADRIRTRPDTIYDLASVSKLFTSIVIMQQVEAGLVSLEAPVTRYLPEFAEPPSDRRGATSPYDKGTITVRQLLTHTSGFPAFLPLWRSPGLAISTAT